WDRPPIGARGPRLGAWALLVVVERAASKSTAAEEKTSGRDGQAARPGRPSLPRPGPEGARRGRARLPAVPGQVPRRLPPPTPRLPSLIRPAPVLAGTRRA